MKFLEQARFALAAVSIAAVSAVFADAANTLVTFSTVGVDYYADGKTAVVDGEWYALVWSPREVFGGLTSAGQPAVEGDRLLLAAPLASGGRCPTVVFQLDSKTAPVDGNYFVILLDTRGEGGLPAAKGADGLPVLVNGAVATTASGKAKQALGAVAVVTDQRLAGGADPQWGETAPASDVAQPLITGFAIEGDRAIIKVSRLAPSVRYNVVTGDDPGTVTSEPLALPTVGTAGEATFNVPKSKGRYFKVTRQPLK